MCSYYTHEERPELLTYTRDQLESFAEEIKMPHVGLTDSELMAALILAYEDINRELGNPSWSQP